MNRHCTYTDTDTETHRVGEGEGARERGADICKHICKHGFFTDGGEVLARVTEPESLTQDFQSVFPCPQNSY